MVGVIVSYFLTLRELNLISLGTYIDGNKRPVAPTKTSKVLFWLYLLVCALILAIEFWVAFVMVSSILSFIHSLTFASTAIGGAAEAVGGVAKSVSKTMDIASDVVNSYESSELIKNLLHWLNSFFE